MCVRLYVCVHMFICVCTRQYMDMYMFVYKQIKPICSSEHWYQY